MGKTRKVMAGITTTVLALGLAGCGSNPPGPPPNDPSCGDWEWDSDDGVWVCDDRSSSHSGSYYHGGRYYKSKSSLQQSSAYKSYKSSSSFKGSSGFGSGSKSFFGG